MKCYRIALVVGLVVLLLQAGPISAQVGSANLSGRVTDPSGNAIVGAKVQAVNTATNAAYPTQTNEVGLYNLPSLPPGLYRIVAEKEGFGGSVRPDVELHVAANVSIDFALQVGKVEQTLTVEGGAPLVNTTSSALGGLVDARQLEDLPLNGRNYIDLTLMQPGVTQDVNEQKNGIYAGSWFSSNGSPIRSNNFLIDGAIMQDQNAGSTADFAGRTLGLDGIQEYRVITNALSAEYGLTMGSQTVMVSKGGTNQFHGSVFDYLRNDVLDAANYFDKPVAANGFRRLPSFKRNNFGASFGGPIRKDKTFFFVAFEGVRERLGVTNILNVPATACHAPAGATVWNGTGTQPAGSIGPCTQLGANPSGAGTNSVKVASVTAPLLALFPSPNLPNNQATLPYTQPDSDNFGQVRIDHKFSPNDSLFGRYTIMDDTIALSLPFSDYFTNPKLTRHQYLTVSEDHIFSSWLLNSFRLSYSRTAANRFGTNTLTDPQYQFVPGSQFPGIGQLRVGGLTAFGPSANPKSLTKQDIYTGSDDLTASHGKHSLKFGARVDRYRIYGLNPTGAQGTLVFGGLSTFLSGRPSSFSGVTSGSILDRTYQFYILGFYTQDDWRVAKNLTLNLGLRYEPAPGYYNEVHGISSTLVNRLSDAKPTVGPLFANNPTLHNFSPRLGFAWDVFGNGTTAVRGGAAMLYDVGNLVDAFNIIKSQPPFSAGTSLNITTPLTSLPVIVPPSAASTDFWMFDYNMKQSRLYTENLTVEQQLPLSSVLSVSYAGSRGIHLIGNQEGNPNIAQPMAGVPGGLFWPSTQVRQNPNWGTMNLIAANRDSIFHALEVNVLKRMSKGLQFQSSYTWARSIDNAQGGRNDCTASSAVGSNPYDPRFDRGPSCFNATQTWSFNFLYSLPSPKFDHSFLETLTGGWGIMGIFRTHTGFPFNVWETTERARSGYFAGTATPPVDRPSWNPAFTGSVITGGPTQYYNPNAFILQPVGTLGNVGRNSLTGPGYSQLDFALRKDTKTHLLGEQGGVEFRAEFFNLLNHPNFAEPNSAVFTGALANATEAPISSAGQITSTVGTSRQIEFSLKLTF
jgi:Carboxypeptidase regulatory-like domain/TonB dependent receptor